MNLHGEGIFALPGPYWPSIGIVRFQLLAKVPCPVTRMAERNIIMGKGKFGTAGISAIVIGVVVLTASLPLTVGIFKCTDSDFVHQYMQKGADTVSNPMEWQRHKSKAADKILLALFALSALMAILVPVPAVVGLILGFISLKKSRTSWVGVVLNAVPLLLVIACIVRAKMTIFS